MASIDKLDKVNIYSSSLLSIDDYTSLTLLYSPVVGPRAISVYQTLYSIINRQTLTSDNLVYINILDLLAIDDDTFYDSRLKLEALGLMETFNKDNEYVFLLKQPLTPKQFLLDSVFPIYLKEALGEEMFDFVVDKFKIAQLDRLLYQNVSVTFDQVFQSRDIDKPFKIDGFIMGRKPNSSVTIKNHTFDFNSFMKRIDDRLISNLAEARKVITNISFIYGYDSDVMVTLFEQSLNTSGMFDTKILKRKADLYNKHLNAGKIKAIEKPNMSDEEYQMMNLIANASMKDILDSSWPGYPKEYLKTINQIYDAIDLERDVLNIMMFYVLKQKGGVLPSLAYFKTVAESWKNDGYDTRESAWKYVRGFKEDKATPKEYKNTYTKPLTKKTNEFTEEYIKNLDEGVKKL